MESTSITETKDDEDKISDPDTHAPLEHKGGKKKLNNTGDSERYSTPHTGGWSTSDISRDSNITHVTSWCSNSVTASPPTQMMARYEEGSEWSNISGDSLFSIQINNSFPKTYSKIDESYETALSSDGSLPRRPSPIKVTRGNYDMVANNRTKQLEDTITRPSVTIDTARIDSKPSSLEETGNSDINQGTTTDDSNPPSTMPLKKKKKWSQRCCCGSKFTLCCCKLPKCCRCKSLRIQDSCNLSLQCCPSCKKPQCNCCHWPKCSSCKRLKCGSCCKWPSYSCCKWPSCSCLPSGPLSCSCLKSFRCCSSSSSCLKCPKGLSCSCLKSCTCCSCSSSCFKCSKGVNCSCFKGSSCCKWPSCNCFKQLSCSCSSCFQSSCKWPSCSCLGSCIPRCDSCGWPSCSSCKWPGCSCPNISRLRHWCSCFCCCCQDKKADGAVQNSDLVQDKKQNSSSKGWFSSLLCK